MAPKKEDTRPPQLSQDEFTAMLAVQMKEAVRLALTTILEAEVPPLRSCPDRRFALRALGLAY